MNPGDWSNLKCSDIATTMRPALCSSLAPAVEVQHAHPVPEPSTVVLLGVAMVGVVVVRWVRRQKG
jgi:hypothetical protein